MTSERINVLGDTFTTEAGRVFTRLSTTQGFPGFDFGPDEFYWSFTKNMWIETDTAFSARIKAAIRDSIELENL